MSEKIVQLNEEVIKGQIKELVRSSVEEALIEMYLAGRFRAPCGGHHRGVAGQQGLACHHQRAEQEILCPHRGLAEPSVTGRALSIRLRGRYLPAPQLGRRVRKYSDSGGNRRK